MIAHNFETNLSSEADAVLARETAARFARRKVRLPEEAKIPGRTVGKYRRVWFDDFMACKN